MILGNYPCCDGHLAIPMAETTPAFEREECPHCGEVVWHLHSRLAPKSYTDRQFKDEYGDMELREF